MCVRVCVCGVVISQRVAARAREVAHCRFEVTGTICCECWRCMADSGRMCEREGQIEFESPHSPTLAFPSP